MPTAPKPTPGSTRTSRCSLRSETRARRSCTRACRQYFEPQQVEDEKRQKQIVTIHGFPFYAAPLDVSPEDAAKLRGLLVDDRSFLQWYGTKACGGFHPDYLAEYRVGGAAFRFLICFGCHEVMVFGPDRSLRCDIQREAYKQLDEILKKYRKNRPASRGP